MSSAGGWLALRGCDSISPTRTRCPVGVVAAERREELRERHEAGGADALDLDFELKVPDRAIRNALRNNKIHIDPTGRGRIHFSGTLANPVYP